MKRKFFRSVLAFAIGLQAGNLSAEPTPPQTPNSTAPLVVHEWGTFTSLQNAQGEAIGGINTDDEPVPSFVHRFYNYQLIRPTEAPNSVFKGIPSCHPDVTMRLETPVVYFHPPPGQPALRDVSLSATFHGGWLSEFYPGAESDAPGVQSNRMSFGPLRSSTVSTLAWNGLSVGGDWVGPMTDAHVWTSPRAVKAAAVRTAHGEQEQFLFYRGVAHIDAPLAISQVAKSEELVLRSQCAPEMCREQALKVNSLWLVDIRTNGEVAFRPIPPVTLSGGKKFLTRVSSLFNPADYNTGNRQILEASLKRALLAEGLFEDEAQALLNTWESSYFKSAGLRVFFMVPRAWTDFYLPLKLSTPAEITRVMVGRIELETPKQQEVLRQIAGLSKARIVEDAKGLMKSFNERVKADGKGSEKVYTGGTSLAAFGVAVPRSYELYLSLGRFRNALILDEARRRPAAGLDSFIAQYRLGGYRPVEQPSAQSASVKGGPRL
ncbi:MAG: hypothetical protein JWR69_2156 [Pedosphaera sp.]|nr:hypothetical protein [Pedosphaera sp.]